MSLTFEEELEQARLHRIDYDSNTAAWIAGLLEGEGCFSLYRQKDCIIHTASITCTSTDEDVIMKLHKLAGFGSVHQRKKQKENWNRVWTWNATGIHAIRLLKSVLPYMCNRRSEKISQLIKTYEMERNLNVT